MKFFMNNINLNNEIQETNREYLHDEKKAFFNALWFFSEDFYGKFLYELKEENDPLMNYYLDSNNSVRTKEGFVLEKVTEGQTFQGFN